MYIVVFVGSENCSHIYIYIWLQFSDPTNTTIYIGPPVQRSTQLS